METLGNSQATRQTVHLLLMNIFRAAFGDDTACSNVVKVVQILGCITTHLVGIDGHQCINRLILKTHIIIIGGIDDGKLGLGIEQTLLLTFI